MCKLLSLFHPCPFCLIGNQSQHFLTALPADNYLSSVNGRLWWKTGKRKAEKDHFTLSLEIPHAMATVMATRVCSWVPDQAAVSNVLYQQGSIQEIRGHNTYYAYFQQRKFTVRTRFKKKKKSWNSWKNPDTVILLKDWTIEKLWYRDDMWSISVMDWLVCPQNSWGDTSCWSPNTRYLRMWLYLEIWTLRG